MKASKMTSSWHILSTIRVYKQSTSTRLLRLSSSASLEVKRNFFTSKSSQENWEGKVGVFLKFIYEMLALIRLKILCSSRLWWNSIVQIELHSHYCLFVKLDQFLGVLYSVEDLVGVYSVCLTIKKKDFNAVRGSHFCRNATYEWSVYPTLSDNRSPRSISLDVLHYSCYVALRIKFSQGQPRQLLGGFFFKY